MLISATYLLSHTPQPSEDEIRRAIQGNICRCTGYVNIVKAVQAVSGGLSPVTEG
jgi:carbon-monoxide dehydrogenase small subunit